MRAFIDPRGQIDAVITPALGCSVRGIDCLGKNGVSRNFGSHVLFFSHFSVGVVQIIPVRGNQIGFGECRQVVLSIFRIKLVYLPR